MVDATSYNRVIAILSGSREEVDRIPCVNSVGVATIVCMHHAPQSEDMSIPSVLEASIIVMPERNFFLLPYG